MAATPRVQLHDIVQREAKYRDQVLRNATGKSLAYIPVSLVPDMLARWVRRILLSLRSLKNRGTTRIFQFFILYSLFTRKNSRPFPVFIYFRAVRLSHPPFSLPKVEKSLFQAGLSGRRGAVHVTTRHGNRQCQIAKKVSNKYRKICL